MTLPIIRISKSKLVKLLRLDDDELKKYKSGYRGEFSVALLNPLLADIVHDLSIIRRKLGLSQINVATDGDAIVTSINSLLAGTLGRGRTAKKEGEELYALCKKVSCITAGDFTALKEFWNLDYTPRQIAQAIQSKFQITELAVTEDVLLAIETLKWISTAPSEDIPLCH